MVHFIHVLILLLLRMDVAFSHASLMLQYCSTSMSAGSNIMGTNAVTTGSNSVIVKRGSTSLTSGTNFLSGEILHVMLQKNGGEFVFEADGGALFSGNNGCNNRRSTDSNAVLQMPTGATGTVNIWAGIAGGYGQVSITNKFTLVGGPSPPTYEPSKAPTLKQTSISYPITQTLVNVPTATFYAKSTIQQSFFTIVQQTLVTQLPVPSSSVNVGNSGSSFSTSSSSNAGGGSSTTGSPLTPTHTPTTTKPSRSPNDDRKRTVHLQAGSVIISYNITFILEKTTYGTVSALSTALMSVLQSSVLLNNLKTSDPITYSTLTSLVVSTSSVPPIVTVLQTAAPSCLPSQEPTYRPNLPTPTQGSVIDANTAGVSTVCVIGGILLLYIIVTASEEKTVCTPTTLFTVVCVTLAVICLGMIGSWAKMSNTASGSTSASVSVSTSTYLGVPDRSQNALAWHTVLMVGGFFFSQILAVLSWRVFPAHFTAKLSHMLWHTLALLMMALGLASIDSYKEDNHEASWTTLHSWIGVAGVVLFCLSYTFGLVMWGCKVSGFEMDMRGGHRMIGGSAVVFAAVAIGTGIVNYLGRTGCAPVPFVSINPDLNQLPDGCKVGNGLGVCVALTMIATLLGVYYRHIDVLNVKTKDGNDISHSVEMLNIPGNGRGGSGNRSSRSVSNSNRPVSTANRPVASRPISNHGIHQTIAFQQQQPSYNPEFDLNVVASQEASAMGVGLPSASGLGLPPVMAPPPESLTSSGGFGITPEMITSSSSSTSGTMGQGRMILILLAGTALILAILSLILVAVWAQSTVTTSTTSTYLGIPDFSQNPLAWHAVLMVGGFFFSQILAVLSWSIFLSSPSSMGKAFHVMGQTASLACMIAAVAAVVNYKSLVQEAQLTTVHSWLGILAITLFCGSYLMGLYMWGVKLSGGGNEGGNGKGGEGGTIRRGIHVALGGSTLLAVTVAITTGIMTYLGRSGCANSSSSSSQGSGQTTDYNSLPASCKISNGLGLVVAGASLCTMATVAWRAILLSSSSALDPISGYAAPEEEGRTYIARPQ